MKLFLDSANLEEIKWAKSIGMLDGVTTNPTLAAKEGRKYEDQLKDIVNICPGPISAEVVSDKVEDMVPEALELSKLGKQINIKVPICEEGLKTIPKLRAKNIKINATLCFSVPQAIEVAKAGATFVSPFVGRLDDRGEDGMQVVEDILTAYRSYNFKTQVIVASIRNLDHVRRAALMGAPIATIPPKVFHELHKHELTDIGIQRFLDDYKKLPK